VMVIIEKPAVNITLAQRGLYGRKIHGRSDYSKQGQRLWRMDRGPKKGGILAVPRHD